MNYITNIGVVNFKKSKKVNEDINDIYEKHINSGGESLTNGNEEDEKDGSDHS
jgi:hypothetical protein